MFNFIFIFNFFWTEVSTQPNVKKQEVGAIKIVYHLFDDHFKSNIILSSSSSSEKKGLKLPHEVRPREPQFDP